MWTWIDDRWHLDGKPVHAGVCAEVRWPDGTWEEVRLESSDRGRRIYAHFEHHGLDLCVRVDADCHGDGRIICDVRWPRLALAGGRR